MRKNVRALIIVATILLIFLSFHFDSEIVRFVFSLKNLYLDKFFWLVGIISSEIILILFLTGLVFYERNKRKNIILLWMTLFLTAAIGFSLRSIIQRARPFQAGVVNVASSAIPAIIKSSLPLWSYSFPSLHAMFVFCAIPLLVKEFPKMKYWWFVFAFLVGISRIYFGLHYLSDVLAGGIIGYTIGWIIFRKRNEIIKKISEW